MVVAPTDGDIDDDDDDDAANREKGNDTTAAAVAAALHWSHRRQVGPRGDPLTSCGHRLHRCRRSRSTRKINAQDHGVGAETGALTPELKFDVVALNARPMRAGPFTRGVRLAGERSRSGLRSMRDDMQGESLSSEAEDVPRKGTYTTTMTRVWPTSWTSWTVTMLQRVQYRLIVGSLIYFQSRQFEKKTTLRMRDVKLTWREASALERLYDVVLYMVPLLVFSHTQLRGLRRTGRAVAMAGALQGLALLPVLTSVEVFALVMIGLASQSVAMVVFAYALAADVIDVTDASARHELWTQLFVAVQVGEGLGGVIIAAGPRSPWILPIAHVLVAAGIAACLPSDNNSSSALLPWRGHQQSPGLPSGGGRSLPGLLLLNNKPHEEKDDAGSAFLDDDDDESPVVVTAVDDNLNRSFPSETKFDEPGDDEVTEEGSFLTVASEDRKFEDVLTFTERTPPQETSPPSTNKTRQRMVPFQVTTPNNNPTTSEATTSRVYLVTLKEIGAAVLDASRRRRRCATPLLASLIAFGGLAVGVVAWTCSEVAYTAAGLLAVAMVLFIGFSGGTREAGYLEASKKRHGGNFDDTAVDLAKDAFLLSPFIGLSILYSAAYYFAATLYIAQWTAKREFYAEFRSGDWRAATRRRFLENYDTAVTILALPVLEYGVYPMIEWAIAQPLRPVSKLGAAGGCFVLSMVISCIADLVRVLAGPHDGHRYSEHLESPRFLPDFPQYFTLALGVAISVPTFYEVFYAEVPGPLRVASLALYFSTVIVGKVLGTTIVVVASVGSSTHGKRISAAMISVAAFSAAVAVTLLIIVWYSRCATTYMYRLDREWTTRTEASALRSAAYPRRRRRRLSSPRIRQFRRNTPASAAAFLLPNGAVDDEETTQQRSSSVDCNLESSMRRPEAASSSEIVAVVRGIFSGLEAQYLIPFSLLKMGKIVASGGSGQVYKGTYAGAPVAIKMLFSQMMDPAYVADVRHEARMLASVRHPHITQFHGISRFEDRLLLVTEFVPQTLDALVRTAVERRKRRRRLTTAGSGGLLGALTDTDHLIERDVSESSDGLDDERLLWGTTFPSSRSPQQHPRARKSYGDRPEDGSMEDEALALARRRPEKFGLDDALRMWVELAHTLIYLHAIGLVHRDIKPSNILLDLDPVRDCYHLKLCDLGMAKFAGATDGVVAPGCGSPGYSPPECYLEHQQRRRSRTTTPEDDDLAKWDVFSFATVMWYSWHCADPFPGLPVVDVCSAIARGDRPRFHRAADAPAALVTLVTSMWQHQPRDRPTAEAVLATLQSPTLVDPVHAAHAAQVAFLVRRGFGSSSSSRNFDPWASSPTGGANIV